MRKSMLLAAMLLVSVSLCGCVPAQTIESAAVNLLTTDDLVDIVLSAPEGSGSLRTLTLHYTQDGGDKEAVLDHINLIDINGYDDEAKEQTFTASDYDGDGIVEFIIYREFWFPDIDATHLDIPLWPTVYEYDLQSGFVVASARHRTYFKAFIQLCENQLASDDAGLTDAARLALKRLVAAAGHIADKSFIPQSPYNGKYYQDVYELTKDTQS